MFDIRFGICPIEPVMIKNEAGAWINLQYLGCIWSDLNPNRGNSRTNDPNPDDDKKDFAVILRLTFQDKDSGIVLKSGFKIKKAADKYINDLFDTLKTMKRGNL